MTRDERPAANAEVRRVEIDRVFKGLLGNWREKEVERGSSIWKQEVRERR